MPTSKLGHRDMREYYDWPLPNLESYLVRQRHGVDTVITTPFAEGESTDKLLDAWSTELSRVIGSEWPTLLSYELEMRAKVGPMSVQQPLDARFDSIDAYYNFVDSCKETLPQYAIDAALREWSRVRGLQIRSKEKTLLNMKLSTNSGSPYFTKRRTVVSSLFPCDIRRTGVGTYEVKQSDWQGPLTATLGWRGQEGGPLPSDVKQRVLWMFPFAGNLQELRVYQVLIEAMQRYNLVSPWLGTEAVDERMTRLFDTKRATDLVIATDFTAFDQHINVGAQRTVFLLLSQLFNGNSEMQAWLENVYPMKYEIPLCVDVGKFTFGVHGMASGSGGTNADETLFHRALQHCVALDHSSKLNLNSQCLGDDGILTYPGIQVSHIMETYKRYGMELNESKQYASTDDTVFLRRWYHTAYRSHGITVGVYPTFRALGRLRYMERYIPKGWGAKAVAMRQLSILENCKYHPAREQFLDFVMKRDKYRLGIDIPNFLEEVDSTFQEALSNDTAYVSYLAQQSLTPPSQWWVVHALRERS